MESCGARISILRALAHITLMATLDHLDRIPQSAPAFSHRYAFSHRLTLVLASNFGHWVRPKLAHVLTLTEPSAQNISCSKLF